MSLQKFNPFGDPEEMNISQTPSNQFEDFCQANVPKQVSISISKETVSDPKDNQSQSLNLFKIGIPSGLRRFQELNPFGDPEEMNISQTSSNPFGHFHRANVPSQLSISIPKETACDPKDNQTQSLNLFENQFEDFQSANDADTYNRTGFSIPEETASDPKDNKTTVESNSIESNSQVKKNCLENVSWLKVFGSAVLTFAVTFAVLFGLGSFNGDGNVGGLVDGNVEQSDNLPVCPITVDRFAPGLKCLNQMMVNDAVKGLHYVNCRCPTDEEEEDPSDSSKEDNVELKAGFNGFSLKTNSIEFAISLAVFVAVFSIGALIKMEYCILCFREKRPDGTVQRVWLELTDKSVFQGRRLRMTGNEGAVSTNQGHDQEQKNKKKQGE